MNGVSYAYVGVPVAASLEEARAALVCALDSTASPTAWTRWHRVGARARVAERAPDRAGARVRVLGSGAGMSEGECQGLSSGESWALGE